MPVATILVSSAAAVAVSTVYTLYAIRKERREERRFNEVMKTRINDIATY